MEFPAGVLKKKRGKLRGQLKKKWNSRSVQEKLIRNFHGSWLTLEFPRGVTQICRIFSDKSFFSLEFFGVKWQI